MPKQAKGAANPAPTRFVALEAFGVFYQHQHLVFMAGQEVTPEVAAYLIATGCGHILREV